MSGFNDLIKKKERIVIGILSGTSVDAVDLVLVKIRGAGIGSKVKVMDFASFPIGSKLKEFLLKMSESGSGTVEDVCRMNIVLGIHYGNCVNRFMKSRGLKSSSVDLIGSHGQTVRHMPEYEKSFGITFRSTLQIGDPSVIANVTGITTVGDFRVADVSAGGSGAPLVPYLDFVMFRSRFRNRLLVNIGGISNITYLPNCTSLNDVMAFDTGPGNMLIDYVVKALFGLNMDKDGKHAFAGKVSPSLLQYIKSADDFYSISPPKSTGRERYGQKFAESILRTGKRLAPSDIVATVSEFTAFSIFHNAGKLKLDEVFVSGGGAKNLYLMSRLKEYFSSASVSVLKHNGITSQNKEAVLFAVLANEIVSGKKANVPSVTGSEKNVFLGKICPA